MNSMSSKIENGLQRQAALPHFLPHFHRIFTEFNSPKIKNFEFWITESFAHFLKTLNSPYFFTGIYRI